MWTEDEPSFSGEFYSIEGASAPPLPDPVPPICIGASGKKFGLPVAGRKADIWNSSMKGGDDDWIEKRGIVARAATEAGRDPADIAMSTTVERALPETDEESEQYRELLTHYRSLGVSHFVLDFGHPQSTEPILRFAEQVMTPMRAA